MAKQSKRSDKVRFGEFKTERVDFNDAERAEINDYLAVRDVTPLEAIRNAIDDNWSVRYTYRDEEGLYQVSLTQGGRSHTYGGCVFILSHPDLDKLEQVFYYFYEEQLRPEKHRTRSRLITDNW